MNTTYPGIFIPFMACKGSVGILRAEEKIPQGCTKLFHALAKAAIQGSYNTAVRIHEQDNRPIEYGVILYLEHPHQMEYQTALQVINQTFGLQIDELTVPINNVPAPGFGIITKSVYVKIASGPCTTRQFNKQAFKLCSLLRQPFLCGSQLILSCIPEGFEIHGTSPIAAGSNPDAWQQYLGQALRKAGYSPAFSQTWSTNADITARLKAQNIERKNNS